MAEILGTFGPKTTLFCGSAISSDSELVTVETQLVDYYFMPAV